MIQIPSKERKEWNDLVTTNFKVELFNFFLRTKVKQTRGLVKQGKITATDAINDLYEICLELNKTRDISQDMEAIFGKELHENDTIPVFPTLEKKAKDPVVKGDITTRISRIQEEAVQKRKAVQEEILKKEAVEANPKKIEDLKENKKPTTSIPKEITKTIEKDVENKNEIKRKASIARRNKVLKENRELLRTKDKSSLGSIIKSIFN